MVGVERDRPLAAFERLGRAAEPVERRRAPRERVHVLGIHRDDALEGLRRLLVASQLVQGDGALMPRGGEAGVVGQNPVIARQRLGRPAEVLQHDGAVHLRVGIARLKRKRAVKAREGLVEPAKDGEHLAATAMERRLVRRKPDRLVDALQRLGVTPLLVGDEPEQVRCILMERMRPRDLRIHRGGPVQVAGPMQRYRLLQPHLDGSWKDAARAAGAWSVPAVPCHAMSMCTRRVAGKLWRRFSSLLGASAWRRN